MVEIHGGTEIAEEDFNSIYRAKAQYRRKIKGVGRNECVCVYMCISPRAVHIMTITLMITRKNNILKMVLNSEE